MRKAHPRHAQRGFLVIAGVFLLVVLAGLVAYLTTTSTTSQAASAADLNASRAYQAARAGVEWGAFQILQAGGSCVPSTDKTFAGTTLAAFTATVTCASASVTEGAATVTAYTIVSTACNEVPCPNTTTLSSTYVERQITVSIVQ
jgi:MSHA biogenesis protein MshP